MQSKTVLSKMLRENTGSHMLDSGGAYGRHWERNQKTDFAKQPAASVEFSLYENGNGKRADIVYTANVYHWLLERVEYLPELQKQINAFAKLPDQKDNAWLQTMETFPKYLAAMGQEVGPAHTFNTYNGECVLSQTLQGVCFELNGQSVVLLQIHGGCDVRGGYTAPKCFAVGEDGLHGEAYGEIHCTKCRANWQTDDSRHWYDNGTAGLNAEKQLEEYPASDKPEKGKLGIDKDGNGYCPKCTGKLAV